MTVIAEQLDPVRGRGMIESRSQRGVLGIGLIAAAEIPLPDGHPFTGRNLVALDSALDESGRLLQRFGLTLQIADIEIHDAAWVNVRIKSAAAWDSAAVPAAKGTADSTIAARRKLSVRIAGVRIAASVPPNRRQPVGARPERHVLPVLRIVEFAARELESGGCIGHILHERRHIEPPESRAES
jgi:hypothetical protein